MNCLFFSDLHLDKSELEECSLVLNEIVELRKTYKVDKVFDLGDTFNGFIPKNKESRPSAEEFDLFSNFIHQINKPIIILAANSHESVNKEESILNHYGILNNNIKIVKEYNDDNHLYLGHFTLAESKINYGSKIFKKSLSKYRFVLLGHQHSYEEIPPNIIHLGSCRYIDFSESQDKAKVIAICEDYRGEQEKWSFIALKSCYPMIDIYLDKNSVKAETKASNLSKIIAVRASYDKIEEKFEQYIRLLPEKTKVRVIFKDFESYTQVINILPKYKNKFIILKEKKDFLISNESKPEKKKENISVRESLTSWLKEKNTNIKIQDILLEEFK